MKSLTGFFKRFTPSWQITIITLVMVGLLLRLGFWQLARGRQKLEMLKTAYQWSNVAPKRWQHGLIAPKQYQPVWVQGTYLATTFFLDNQYVHHQWGYDVLSPFLLETGGVVLIDRGWVLGDPSRRTLPKIDTPNGPHKVQGLVYYPYKNFWINADLMERHSNHEVVIPGISLKLIQDFLHKSIEPFIIRLDKNAQNGFVREWAIVSMSPKKHDAYAFQWFAMALAVVIIYLILNFNKK